MFTYIFLLSLGLYIYGCHRLVSAKHHINYNSREWKTFYTMIFLAFMSFLLVISGIRNDIIGADHKNYINEFNHIKQYGYTYFIDKGEYGYYILNKLLIKFGGGTLSLNFLTAGLLIYTYSYHVIKNVTPEKYFFCIIIFAFQPYMFIQSTFNILRQGCAFAFIIIACNCLYDKKKIKFIVFIIVAATFHKSSLFYILIYPLSKIRLNANRIRYAAIIALVLNLVHSSDYLFYLTGKIIQYGDKGIGFESSALNNLFYIVFIFVILMSISNFYGKLIANIDNPFWINIQVYSLIFLLFALQNDLLYRLYIGIAIVSVPGIAQLIKYLKGKYLIETIVVIYYSLFYLGYILLWYFNKDYNYYPYQTMFK